MFPTQELNQGLLRCRQILYQLGYQGSLLPGWSFVIDASPLATTSLRMHNSALYPSFVTSTIGPNLSTLTAFPFSLSYPLVASLVAQMVKHVPAVRETWVRFNPWVGKTPWRRQWHPTPVLLPWKSHGWRSLVGYSPWGHKELDMTEQLHILQINSFWSLI